MHFKIDSKIEKDMKPAGDQPQAIEKLANGVKKGLKHQTLLGVTGSGKTFTMAKVIEKVQKPTLVICHNKTLAAQLVSEYRRFFPKNAVEYFVSYYDYYQPEAYLPNTDVYIEKDLQINMEIDRLRHAATQALLSRRDVIIVASVSCIYGLGDPRTYRENYLYFNRSESYHRTEIIKKLINLYFLRSEILERGRFRVRGETIEIMPASQDIIYHLQFNGDILESIVVYEAVSMKKIGTLEELTIFSAKHFIVEEASMQKAIKNIESDLEIRLDELEKQGKILEAERLGRRTRYDLEMMREVGYCSGIENYSRYLTGRKPGEPPYTLLDYFGDDFLTIIDESHVTIPQLHGMFAGDFSRKKNLIDFGFRLPSAYDNRPIKFPEFEKRIGQVIYTTATPSDYEKKHSGQIVEQIIRPTGLVDPEIEIKKTEGQIDDLILEIKDRAAKHERVLVTALTKKMAEELAEYLKEEKVKPTASFPYGGIKSEYLHSEVETLDRIRILEKLRRGEIDCLVGVNLLREGLDLPEVTLVAILDADKEGFLRSDVSLIQTIGRAARNVKGKVILYADNITGSMRRAIDETNRRRAKQIKYNVEHKITPKTIEKKIESIIDHEIKPELSSEFVELESLEDLPAAIKMKTNEMKQAAKELQFEKAAVIRDEIMQLKKLRFK